MAKDHTLHRADVTNRPRSYAPFDAAIEAAIRDLVSGVGFDETPTDQRTKRRPQRTSSVGTK